MKRYWTTYRGKNIFDGSKNISEMIARLRESLADLQKMKTAGVELEEEVFDDDVTLTTDNAKVARKFGLTRMDYLDDASEEFTPILTAPARVRKKAG
jgi:hypothetical protein